MAKRKEKGFFGKMMASGTSDTVSSKRFTMVLAMMMLVGLAIASACGYNCDTTYVIVFASLVGAQSGMSTIEKCARGVNRTKIEVARAEFVDKNHNGIDDREENEDNEDEEDY